MTIQNRFHLLYVDEAAISEEPKAVLNAVESSTGKVFSVKKSEKDADISKAEVKDKGAQASEPLKEAQASAEHTEAEKECQKKAEQIPETPPLQLKSYKEYLAEQTARFSSLSISRPEQRRSVNDGAKIVDGFEPVMSKATSLVSASEEDAWMMGSGASSKKAATKPVASKQFVEASMLAFKSVSNIEDDGNTKQRNYPRRFERDQRPFESRPRKPMSGEQADGQKREFRPRRDQTEKRSFRPRTSESGENPDALVEGAQQRTSRPRIDDSEKRAFRPRRDDVQQRSFRPRDPRPEGQVTGFRVHASSKQAAGHRGEEFPALT